MTNVVSSAKFFSKRFPPDLDSPCFNDTPPSPPPEKRELDPSKPEDMLEIFKKLTE